jgi:serine O-acetyltransferase
MFENIKTDIKRFGDGRISLRIILRGLLSQGFQAIVVYRFFHWLQEKNIPAQPFRFIIERFIEITTGISIPAECKIGKGLRIHHFGSIIMHPKVQIGDNCTLYHEVTIGDRGGHGGAATIGNNVLIGVGAKIIGEIAIGDNCKIGANTVVNKNVPADTIVSSPYCDFHNKNVS